MCSTSTKPSVFNVEITEAVVGRSMRLNIVQSLALGKRLVSLNYAIDLLKEEWKYTETVSFPVTQEGVDSSKERDKDTLLKDLEDIQNLLSHMALIPQDEEGDMFSSTTK